MDSRELYDIALEAAGRAYAPYSKFRVGAALLCSDGKIYTGVNVENRSFGLTICAERSALATAIGEGRTDFARIAIATPDSDYPVSPCGACRQVLSEFVGADFPVRFGNSVSSFVDTSVGTLFPHDALHELSGGERN